MKACAAITVVKVEKPIKIIRSAACKQQPSIKTSRLSKAHRISWLQGRVEEAGWLTAVEIQQFTRAALDATTGRFQPLFLHFLLNTLLVSYRKSQPLLYIHTERKKERKREQSLNSLQLQTDMFLSYKSSRLGRWWKPLNTLPPSLLL